jgi:type III pantothenate kinase
MLLVVDIGNTNVVFGLYEGTSLTHTFRISTVRTATADEYGVMLQQLILLRGIDAANIEGAIVASVVPPVTDTMMNAIRNAFAREPLLVGPGLKTGMSVLYENPKEVGADRIVNSVAAYDRVHGPLIVVDFGTATTFDCVSSVGEYLGGVIIPGILVGLDGLFAHAAKLSRIELLEPPRVLGRNTTHALQSGVIFGCAALVDGLVDRLNEELEVKSTVIATGGLAGLVARHARRIESVEPNLTLEGLRLIYERNRRVPTTPPSTVRRAPRSP